MLLRFEIDSDFSSNYMKRQIDEIISLLNALYEKKLKDDEEEEEIQYVGKSKSEMKKKKKKDDDDEVDLLELIQEEINEQELKGDAEVVEPVVAPVVEKKESDPKIICECGGSFIKRNKLRHDTSKTHKQFVALKNISNK
jgi:hypothetical protein